MAEGWKCPNCGKAHGPHVDTCPETAATPIAAPVIVWPHLQPLRPVPMPVYEYQRPYWLDAPVCLSGSSIEHN